MMDINTKSFPYYHTLSGDADGKTHGFYYKWASNALGIKSGDFIFYSTKVAAETFDQDKSIKGFHIPKVDDITKFAKMIGGTSRIPQMLEMDYDAYYADANYPSPYDSGHAGMWVDLEGHGLAGNIVEGCGVVGDWARDKDNKFAYSFTNMTDLGSNLRMVKDLN